MSKNIILPFFLDEQKRDTVLILPGGAYSWTSLREGLPVVRAFQKADMHAAIFEYRHEKKLFPFLLEEAIELIAGWRTDARIDRLFICGFSAGGHLAILLMERKSLWFAGGILAYPVVTGNPKYSHIQSIENLLGEDRSSKRVEAVSLERHIPKKMPAIFLWHTMDDQSVPVENSFLLLKALKKKQIPTEAHFFPNGRHGLSLAIAETVFAQEDPVLFAQTNRHVAEWFAMAIAWIHSLDKSGFPSNPNS
jgi:acetyl esterase/lipase